MLLAIFFLLNLSFAITFLYIIYKAVIWVRKEIGIWAAIVLVIGVLPSSINSPKNDIPKFKYNTEKIIANGIFRHKLITIDDNWLNDIHLSVNYVSDEVNSQYIPIEATCFTTGISSINYQWIPNIINIKPTSNPKRLAYEVRGSIIWKFFALTNYSEGKIYKGFIDIK